MIQTLNEIRKGFFKKKHFAARFFAVVLSNVVIGFSLSWLILVDMGTDPCSLMNLAVSDTLGMSMGNWQALFNTILFVIVIFGGARNIGFGTLANMFLVGYSIDFFSWIWSGALPEGWFESWGIRIAVVIPALILFILAVAVYIDMDMGTAPYDAIPIILARRLPKVSFRLVRIVFDGIVTVIAVLFGGMPGIVTVLMVFALGPVIAWVGNQIKSKWDFSDEDVYDSTENCDKITS